MDLLHHFTGTRLQEPERHQNSPHLDLAAFSAGAATTAVAAAAIVGATATARGQCLEKIDSAMSHLRNRHSSPKRFNHVLKTYTRLLLQEQGRSTGNHGS